MIMSQVTSVYWSKCISCHDALMMFSMRVCVKIRMSYGLELASGPTCNSGRLCASLHHVGGSCPLTPLPAMLSVCAFRDSMLQH